MFTFLTKIFGKQNTQNALRKRRLAKLTNPNYGYLFDKSILDDTKAWVCLDFEMTGLNPKTDHILSVGAVKIVKDDTGFSLDTASSLSLVCRPPVMPTEQTIVIHGLRPIDLTNGISYDQMLDKLLPMIGTNPIVGFATKMDMAFLQKQVKQKLGVTLLNQCIDVSMMEQNYRQQKTKNPDMVVSPKHLHTLIKEYNIPLLPAHDALNDALMTAMVFCAIQHKFASKN